MTAKIRLQHIQLCALGALSTLVLAACSSEACSCLPDGSVPDARTRDAAPNDASPDSARPDANVVAVSGLGPTSAACALPAPPPDPVCGASGGGRCFYIDAARGDDSGDGTWNEPWRSLANVVTYYGTPGELGSTPRPSTAVDLSPGDHVYLANGTYSQVFNHGGNQQVAMFRGVDGTPERPIHLAAYPGHTPVIAPSGRAVGIYFLDSHHWRVEGIEVRDAYQFAVWLADSSDVRLSHLHVHDTDGLDNDNTAGIHVLGSSEIEVACSTVHDNFDRANADTGGEATENSSNLVAFGGGDLHIHHSAFYQSPAIDADATGGCVKYKHAATQLDAVFEVDHNVFSRCRFFAIGTGTQHTHAHHDLILEGEGIVSRNFGGPTRHVDQVFDHLTIVPAEGAIPFGFEPDDDLASVSGIVLTNSVIVEARAAASQERGTVVIGPYLPDALFQATRDALEMEGNCYDNSEGEPHFALFAAMGGEYGSQGGQYDLAGWQALGFDADSRERDLAFIDAAGGDYRLTTASGCENAGAYAP